MLSIIILEASGVVLQVYIGGHATASADPLDSAVIQVEAYAGTLRVEGRAGVRQVQRHRDRDRDRDNDGYR